MNDLLLKALHCENRSRPPIWLMRQAGRYLPQYRAIRQRHSFLKMCHEPELAAEITLLPISLLEFDAAILFSDILVVVEALGLGLHYDDGAGPVIERPLNCAADVHSLPQKDAGGCLSYVGNAIRLLRPQLNVPLLGFCGAPFTVASYMIEGRTSRELRKTKQWMLKDPDSFLVLLDKIAALTIDYLKMQIDAGVQAVQIFDSWAHVLGHTQFREFSLAYLDKINSALKVHNKRVPVILFCRGSSVFASQLSEIAPAAVSLDWNCDITAMRKAVPANMALQGNLDPDVLYAPKEVIKKEARRILQGMQGDPGYIFNLGHGILPDVPVDAVKTLVETVKAYT